MNYDSEINRLVEAIKADKSIIQPWRNKAVARAEECQAFVRMGLTTASAKVGTNYPMSLDPQSPPWEANLKSANDCICPPGAVDDQCPIHGGA